MLANIRNIEIPFDNIKKIKNTNEEVSKFTFMEVIVFHGISSTCESMISYESLQKQVIELFDLQIQQSIQTLKLMNQIPEHFNAKQYEFENLIA